MAYKSHVKAVNKYNKSNYTQITVRVKKEDAQILEDIKRIAQKKELSTNEFLLTIIKRTVAKELQ